MVAGASVIGSSVVVSGSVVVSSVVVSGSVLVSVVVSSVGSYDNHQKGTLDCSHRQAPVFTSG